MKEKIALIVLLLALLLVGFFYGCTKTPEFIKDDPQSCNDYRWCLYYSAVSKTAAKDCTAMFIKCCKDRDYRYCKRVDPDKFQQCWDKLQ